MDHPRSRYHEPGDQESTVERKKNPPVNLPALLTRRKRKTYHALFGLCEIVDCVPVQNQLSNGCDRRELDRDDFCGIQQVKAPSQDIALFHDLHANLPLRVVAGLNGIEEVRAVEIGVLAVKSQSLGPYEGSETLLGLEVVLDKLGFAFVVDEAEGMNTETINVPVRPRDTVARHCPEVAIYISHEGDECIALNQNLPQ